MLSFPVTEEIKKTNFPNTIEKFFSEKLIFFHSHNEDKYKTLLTISILDIKNQEQRIITSFSKENYKKLTQNNNDDSAHKFITYHGPHSVIECESPDEYIIFIEYRDFFYHLNLKEKKISLITGKDLGISNVQKFGATMCQDDRSHFFLNTLEIHNNTPIQKYYKVSTSLKNIYCLMESNEKNIGLAHSIKKIDNHLLISNFYSVKLKNLSTNQILTAKEFLKNIYLPLYKDYCTDTNQTFSKKTFLELTSQQSDFCTFMSYCDEKYATLPELIEFNNYQILPGEIGIINLANKKSTITNTSTCSPAHFEISPVTNEIYSSSHNFAIFEGTPPRMIFFGPAAIDKFILKNGKLIKKGTFMHPHGARFTSHIIKNINNIPHIFTIGTPDTLFIINGKTMELTHKQNYQTIKDIETLDEKSYIEFINKNYSKLSSETIPALEVSNDAKFVILLHPKGIILFDIEKKAFSKIFSYNLHSHNLSSTHLQYIN